MRADARKRLAESPPLLIGLIGKKRSGKDTFAATLTAERGFTRFAFADPLKEAALALDPIVGVDEWEDEYEPSNHGADPVRLSEIVSRDGWEKAKEFGEVRRTLQNYGVAIREIDPGFWVRTTMSRARTHEGPVVITDVRFPNEVEAVHDAGGLVIRITRPDLISTDTHVSETALDDYPADLEVVNAGTVNDLSDIARELSF